jgi:hypothetical protein
MDTETLLLKRILEEVTAIRKELESRGKRGAVRKDLKSNSF